MLGSTSVKYRPLWIGHRHGAFHPGWTPGWIEHDTIIYPVLSLTNSRIVQPDGDVILDHAEAY